MFATVSSSSDSELFPLRKEINDSYEISSFLPATTKDSLSSDIIII